MKCPECGENLIWNNDQDIDEKGSEFAFYSHYSCTPCNIDVFKNHEKE